MIRSAKIIALFTGILTFGVAAPGLAQEQETRATHGAWKVICIAGSDRCAMEQVAKSSKGDDALLMRINKVDAQAQDGTKIPASAEIIVPLGVILPAGLRVQIDTGKTRATGFQMCVQIGCLSQDVISEEFLADLKKGSTAKMTLVLPRDGEVSVNISLSGFTKAFNTLKVQQVN
ncbi:MAG: invasion associated locus B family protein [Pseudomonadota bacterium]